MAVWTDPLDELIAELEAVLPAKNRPCDRPWSSVLLDLQAITDIALYGSEEDQAQLETNPHYLRYMAYRRSLQPASAATTVESSRAPTPELDSHAEVPVTRDRSPQVDVGDNENYTPGGHNRRDR